MKLKYLIPALAPMLLAACTVDEEVLLDGTNGKVAFATAIENASRAGAAQTLTVDNMTDFKVTAYTTKSTTNADGTTKNTFDKIFFKEIVVTKQGKSPSYTWATDGDYYWGKDNLNFFAYSAYPKENLGASSVKFTQEGGFPVLQVTASNKQDSQFDLVSTQRKNVAPTNDPVMLTFNHDFAQIEFKVKGLNPAHKYTIDRIGIKNVLTTGKIWGGDGQSRWTNVNDEKSRKTYTVDLSQNKNQDILTFIGAKDMKAVAAMPDDCPYIYVIPQKLTGYTNVQNEAGKSAIYVGLKIMQKTEDGKYNTQLVPEPNANTQTIKNDCQAVYIPFTYTFEAGKKYVITLNVTGGGENSSGDDVLPYKITFDVKVSGFTQVDHNVEF